MKKPPASKTDKKPKTLSIGGATYDLFVRLHGSNIGEYNGREALAFPLGDKIRVKEVIETEGGGACNTAIGLSRLNCEARFAGVIGDDQWGQVLVKNFLEEGVKTDCLTIVEDEISSFSIILSGENGERVILYEPGTNGHLHDATFNKEMASRMDWVYLNHIQENTCIIEDDLIEILTADNGPFLTWNPGGCQIKTGLKANNNRLLLGHTNLLLLNRQEVLAFTELDDTDKAMRKLLETGAKNICITDGSRGTCASDGKNIYNCPALKNTIVKDTTGAGDAFGTGVTWALINKLPLPDALKAGTINAASVVSYTGAQAGLLTDTDMWLKIKDNPLTVSEKTL